METLIAEGIGKSYKGRQVVRGVDLRISRGEVVGLLGPNGAGKTTSFYIIVGLVVPETGRVLVNDSEITRVPMYLRARNYGISYLPQEPSVFRKLTVEENILAVLEGQPLSYRERRRRAERLINQLNLSHIRTTRGYALSGGERRRVEIARSLCIQPKFILLDEPFSGIDPIAVLELQKIIFDLKASGIGDPGHRPQRARDAERDRPRVHHRRGQDLHVGDSARAGKQSRGTADLPGRRFFAELSLITG